MVGGRHSGRLIDFDARLAVVKERRERKSRSKKKKKKKREREKRERRRTLGW
jgi:hypothetical protein